MLLLLSVCSVVTFNISTTTPVHFTLAADVCPKATCSLSGYPGGQAPAREVAPGGLPTAPADYYHLRRHWPEPSRGCQGEAEPHYLRGQGGQGNGLAPVPAGEPNWPCYLDLGPRVQEAEEADDQDRAFSLPLLRSHQHPGVEEGAAGTQDPLQW